MAKFPERSDIFHAVADARATIVGTPKSVARQAIALLEADGFTVRSIDRAAAYRLVVNHDG